MFCFGLPAVGFGFALVCGLVCCWMSWCCAGLFPDGLVCLLDRCWCLFLRWFVCRWCLFVLLFVVVLLLALVCSVRLLAVGVVLFLVLSFDVGLCCLCLSVRRWFRFCFGDC